MGDLYQLVYVSRATQGFSADDLNALLKSARLENARRDVTGMLLYDDPLFIQLLEGPRAAVEAIFARILADTRHREIDVIHTCEGIGQRQFARWWMGCRILGGGTAEEFAALDIRLKEALRKARANSDLAAGLLVEFSQLDSQAVTSL